LFRHETCPLIFLNNFARTWTSHNEDLIEQEQTKLLIELIALSTLVCRVENISSELQINANCCTIVLIDEIGVIYTSKTHRHTLKLKELHHL
jgi:hypothetical protein